ncbi:MAG: cyclic nucleotide-binding domain-containing protein [Alphaproteobacteria bacterium]|nr:cyclic nucleotide-binding domain-containing protein [Alphaproteobacteria bacterium]
MSEADIALILAQPFFAQIDTQAFPAQMPLADILSHDSRIVRYEPGEVIIRRGDYGNSLFAVVEGTVRVLLQSPRGLQRRAPGQWRRWSRAFASTFGSRRRVENRDLARYQIQTGGTPRAAYTRIRDLDRIVAETQTVPLGQGEIFGEIAALTRQARSADVVAETPVTAVEIRWQGIRDIRRFARPVRDQLNDRYRDRTLANTLAREPLFAGLDAKVIEAIASESLIETYGEEDWYLRLQKLDLAGRLEQEPVIVAEGHQLDDVLFILSGFGRVTETVERGQRTIGYVRAGEAHGLRELLEDLQSGGIGLRRTSLRAIGTVNVLRIPSTLVEHHILPTLAPGQLRPQQKSRAGEDSQRRLDFIVDGRYMNGTATMVIDLARCTGCDDCVRACASAHDNNPRFVRHGHSEANLMIANACMHCVDPVCLIGCPTGAIRRIEETRTVAINDAACIGCQTCANSCPYSNIRMVEIRDTAGKPVLDADTNQPIIKATKCDLCFDTPGGPSCERACPHDALIRMDMQDPFSLLKWIER